jgi:hypothetical protein
MKILIPIGPYNDFVQKCDPLRPEYETLRNGFVTKQDGDEVVEIHCDAADAIKLLDLARQMKVVATIWIEKSMGL